MVCQDTPSQKDTRPQSSSWVPEAYASCQDGGGEMGVPEACAVWTVAMSRGLAEASQGTKAGAKTLGYVPKKWLKAPIEGIFGSQQWMGQEQSQLKGIQLLLWVTQLLPSVILGIRPIPIPPHQSRLRWY